MIYERFYRKKMIETIKEKVFTGLCTGIGMGIGILIARFYLCQ